MTTGPDFLRSLPSWVGTTFVPKFNSTVPDSLDPARQSLPSPFVAVVTGAGRTIGKATAISLAQAGATGLILTARTTADLEVTEQACRATAREPTLRITLVSADQALESSAVAVADAIKHEHDGRVDLLVNNAGVRSTDETAVAKLADINSSQIEIPTQLNYVARFYMIKHLLPLMLERGAKAIVNISSIGSHLPAPLGYSISTLATNRLSQRVADAYADQGVFCCALHPGAVLSEKPAPGLSERTRNASKDSPYLCGAFVIWLIKENRDWLNGRYLDATWDVEELEKKKDEIVQGDKLKMRLVV